MEAIYKPKPRTVGTKDKPDTMWVDCALWGKRATSLQPYLFKGNRVTVSGPIRLEEYQAKDGTTKTRLRLSVDQLDLPPKGSDQSSTQPSQHQQDKANGYQPQRITSSNFGQDWSTRTFGNKGARHAALLKKKGKAPLLRETWHNNAPRGSADTLRARYELP